MFLRASTDSSVLGGVLSMCKALGLVPSMLETYFFDGQAGIIRELGVDSGNIRLLHASVLWMRGHNLWFFEVFGGIFWEQRGEDCIF